MKLMRGALKSAIAMKAFEIVKREAAKPQNQQKAKDLLAKVANRGGSARRPR
jgi:hypothetical protein